MTITNWIYSVSQSLFLHGGRISKWNEIIFHHLLTRCSVKHLILRLFNRNIKMKILFAINLLYRKCYKSEFANPTDLRLGPKLSEGFGRYLKKRTKNDCKWLIEKFYCIFHANRLEVGRRTLLCITYISGEVTRMRACFTVDL